MNYPFIFHQLSVVCVLLGAFMFLSLPWALSILGGQWQDEASGVLGLILSIVACFLSAGIFRYFGSKTLKNVPPDLFSKREAIAVVGLAWILATLLGALPYLIAGVHRAENTPMTVCDALFESQSGFSTTGATVFGEVERPDLLPRCILFWRFSTHFLGGLGIMLLFVVLLGYGTGSGFGMGMKSILRSEMTGPTKAHSQNHIQELGRIVFWIYVGMNVVQTTILVFLGVDLFDAICHSFTTVSTGGFSTFNASAGHFAAHGFSAASAIEWTLIIFMFLGGMNFMLLYLGLTGKMMAILKDAEWRAYVSVLLVAIVVLFAVGMVGKDFDNYGTADVPYYVSNEVSKVPIGKKTPQHSPTEKEEFYDETEEDRPNPEGDEPGNLVAIPNETLIEAPRVLVPVLIALRVVVFQVVSIMTTTGLCTDEYEKWSGLSCCVIILLMFLGGCAGSTAGGFKIICGVFIGN